MSTFRTEFRHYPDLVTIDPAQKANMNHQQLLEQVKHFVVRYFRSNHNSRLIYHNLEHTESVVSNAAQIARHYRLNDRDQFIVSCAAWFHDAGYYNGDAAEHESRGAHIAAGFLREQHADEEIIKAVQGCIIATRIPQAPHTLVEQIVCDADLFHFGTTDFVSRNKLMRKEMELRLDKKIPKSDWRKGTIRMMEAHRFQTDYCRNLLNEQKRKNINELKKKDTEEGVLVKASPYHAATETLTNPAPAPTTKKVKVDRPERGIETMFRISSANHQRLSDMADNKAHIMITTTSIIISVLLSVLLRKLEDNPRLVIPTMVLLSVCVITMVFSILATRPTLPHGTFTQEEINNKKVNLLFFGNYYRMSFDDFDNGMKKMMNDREFLYGSLTRDVYSQGLVLGRKYGLLRKGYNVFMYGIVISVISFLIASLFFK
jgi:predicted metal-dependent HD superfamily phosphohydrolase